MSNMKLLTCSEMERGRKKTNNSGSFVFYLVLGLQSDCLKKKEVDLHTVALVHHYFQTGM